MGACGGVAVGREGEGAWGRGGKDILVCVHLACVKILVRWWMAWMDGVDGVPQLSLNWANSCRKCPQ